MNVSILWVERRNLNKSFFFQENANDKSKVNVDTSGQSANGFLKSNNNPSSPPESVFVRLTPSRQRYSFRDEL